jgi:hypothetical protein
LAPDFGTFDLVAVLADRIDTGRVAQFFRIVEREDGSWWYRRGREDLKRFWQVDDAIEYATGIASEHRPSEVRVNHFDGRSEVVARFE